MSAQRFLRWTTRTAAVLGMSGTLIACGASGAGAGSPVRTGGTLASAKAQLSVLTPGLSSVVVAVPGGYEAAVYDQRGHIYFWDLGGAGPWTRVATRSYPPDGGGASPYEGTVSVSGALLVGSPNATFIVQGLFTGDGTGNAVAFGTGAAGWGVLVVDKAGTSLASTGRGLPQLGNGVDFEDAFVGGELQIRDNSGAFSEAFGSAFPIVRNWRWSAPRFVLASDDIVTAQGAASPPVPEPTLRSASPPNGTYAALLRSASVLGVDGAAVQRVGLNLSPTTGKGTYHLSVSANTLTVYPDTRAGETRYVTGPAWPLAGLSGDLAGGALGSDPWDQPSSYDQFGATPWYIPPALVGSSFQFGEAQTVEVSFHAGTITKVALLTRLG